MTSIARLAGLGALTVAALTAASPPAAAQIQLTRAVISGGATAASGGTYTLRATVGEPTVGSVAAGPTTLCQGFWCATIPWPVELDVRVVLQGAYSAVANAMRADLTLPAVQPYAAAVYNGTPLDYDGPETNASPPPTAVDWVLVQLRTTPAAADAVETVAALLLADGTIVDASGTGSPTFTTATAGAYHVVVLHRNHLAAMTAAPVTALADLTTAGAAYGTAGTAPLGGGVFGLWAGDGDGSGTVLAPDRQTVWLPQVGAVGYRAGDFLLDGSVLADDRQTLWLPNVGRQSQVPGASARPAADAAADAP